MMDGEKSKLNILSLSWFTEFKLVYCLTISSTGFTGFFYFKLQKGYYHLKAGSSSLQVLITSCKSKWDSELTDTVITYLLETH